MSQKTLPWPLFVNQGLYIPKRLSLRVGSCHIFFSFSRSRSQVKGHSLKIDGINDFIMIYVQYSSTMWSKPRLAPVVTVLFFFCFLLCLF